VKKPHRRKVVENPGEFETNQMKTEEGDVVVDHLGKTAEIIRIEGPVEVELDEDDKGPIVLKSHGKGIELHNQFEVLADTSSRS
jgi:hypothetical protein